MRPELMSSCRALVVTAREEFGIAAVEAQAAGRPVIGAVQAACSRPSWTASRAAGGTAADELAAAVAEFDPLDVDPAACVENASRFDAQVFRERFRSEVDAALREGPVERLDAWPRILRRSSHARRPVWPSRFGPA